jgi:hypothetical protein
MAQAIDHKSLEWMPKSVWGPIKWKELHCRALAPLPMDGEEKWFEAYMQGLPCAKCRTHFEEFIKQNPPDFHSRERFFKWTVRAHNHVNRAHNKPTLKTEEALRLHRDAWLDVQTENTNMTRKLNFLNEF